MNRLKLLLGTFLLSAGIASAAPGDTTWVQANVSELSWYGNYDSTVSFPTTGTYRNIYMVVTIGKYVCPGSPTYCGDWDYTVQNFLMTPGGDTLELGRLITPYANSGAPRTPNSWTHRYVFDVTDYASKLQGTGTVRIHYSGYSGGFTGNIKFAFVEGTPDRNVTGIQRLWRGSYGYGGATDIDTYFPEVTATAPAGTQNSELKFLITGHGSDNVGCCEFLSKNYQVVLNSTSIATKAIWRDDCGLNELYPQSGTWLFDRANWCPGDLVDANVHKLTGVSAGTPFNIKLDFDSYTSTGGSLGSYITEAQLIHYGPINKTKDASIEDIIAPTNNENHFRQNPICGTPIITVKNRGAAFINLITFEYGIKDSVMQSYTWSGALNPLETANLSLPDLIDLESIAGSTGNKTFVAKIIAVNGSDDADTTNNMMMSEFVPSPKWDGQFRVMFRPNNQGSAGISQTNWKIYDQNNVVVRERINASINTLYTDTVTLPTGCYRFEISDGGCDGLHWWLYDANPSVGVNAGSLFVKKYTSNANIPMNGYVYSGTYAHDFGCKYTQYFYTNTPVSGVHTIEASSLSIEVYPNPAKDVVYIDIAGLTKVSGKINIIDVVGRVVQTVICNDAHIEINTEQLNMGLYTVLFVAENGDKLQSKLLINK